MNYLWQDFNIKTFAAETVVFRDGVFIPDLSTLKSTDINNNYDLPVHIIYIGEIIGDNNLDININIENQKVYLSLKLKNKLPADLKINVKNAGKGSVFKGSVIIENESEFILNNNVVHKNSNTEIIIQTKLVASDKSISKLTGSAVIEKDFINCVSDIGFSAIAEKDAVIEFTPKQYISSPPLSAEHNASIYKPNDMSVQYLKESGLDYIKVNKVLKQAFIDDNSLF